MHLELERLSKLVSGCFIILLLGACSTYQTGMIVLLPQDNHPTGEVEVIAENQSANMDQPWQTVSLNNKGNTQPKEFDEAEINQIFGLALAALPPEPISVYLYFKFDSIDISADSNKALNKIFSIVAERDIVEVQITGHTDTFGPGDVNDLLSLERATLMRDLLIARGLTVSSIKVTSRGERQLLVETADNVKEALNRRVEVIIR
jgi:outer membrane protein OmpA-like peptidoglycan-associated protein